MPSPHTPELSSHDVLRDEMSMPMDVISLGGVVQVEPFIEPRESKDPVGNKIDATTVVFGAISSKNYILLDIPLSEEETRELLGFRRAS